MRVGAKVRCQICGSDETCTIAHGMEKSSNSALFIPMQSTTTAHATQRTTGRLFHYCQQSECGRDEFDTVRGENSFSLAINKQSPPSSGKQIQPTVYPFQPTVSHVHPVPLRETVTNLKNHFLLLFALFCCLSQHEHQRSRASKCVAHVSKGQCI